MGAWGTGLYQDDTTCDVKEDYINLLKIGTEPKDAMKEMIENWKDCIEMMWRKDHYFGLHWQIPKGNMVY